MLIRRLREEDQGAGAIAGVLRGGTRHHHHHHQMVEGSKAQQVMEEAPKTLANPHHHHQSERRKMGRVTAEAQVRVLEGEKGAQVQRGMGAHHMKQMAVVAIATAQWLEMTRVPRMKISIRQGDEPITDRDHSLQFEKYETKDSCVFGTFFGPFWFLPFLCCFCRI